MHKDKVADPVWREVGLPVEAKADKCSITVEGGEASESMYYRVRLVQ
ncbi:MAG: hypothetical protein K9N48_01890 [Verrucomicrobia bacterium]|nr:hypothetical protein [Verrucomicrobiota bacterium]